MSIVYLPGMVTRWYSRRTMPVEVEEEDEATACHQTKRSAHARYVQPDPHDGESSRPTFRDVGAPVQDWQSFSKDELAEEIADWLCTHRFAFTLRERIPLCRD